ncbi:MAG TPA: hypothetical protein VFK16_11290 [Gemmatimonadaceae bacterium]|jgi:hypothetical protein|nr:hypothetical protein [Gemmatimonadaceae bacterium]
MVPYRSPDGIEYEVEVAVPAASNAVVYFRHPDGRHARLDRYSWYLNQGPEARSVTSRLDAKAAEESLDQAALHRLFRRSMPVSRPAPAPRVWRSRGANVGRN